MSNTRLIEKMQKLLAMTRSTNENEAMAATRRLHSMLAKHNVSMTELEQEEETVGKNSFESKQYRPWIGTIMVGVAKLYFCKSFLTKVGKSTTINFVGTEANREFATHIFNMIIKTINKQARAESRARYGKENCSFVNSFRNAAAGRIWERCNELVKSAMDGNLQDEEGNTLPALLNQYALAERTAQDWLDNNVGNMTQDKNRSRSTNVAGINAGRSAGDKVQLSRAVQSKQSAKLLN